MKGQNPQLRISRRSFMKMGAGLLGAAAAVKLVPKALLQPVSIVQAAPGQAQVTGDYMHFVATDGWIGLPPSPAVPPFHPDNMAPSPFTTYVFGFRSVTAFEDNSQMVFGQKMKAMHTGPTWWLDQNVPFTLRITNLGLQMRPDLIDAHTVHFHGFRDAIPIFDGEPHSSVGVPINRELMYYYVPHWPGTYLYHCHFEETEHVHMGMEGVVFIRPEMGPNFCYNDASTQFERQFVMCLTESWALAHWCDSHIQLPEWTDYNPDHYMLNGRCYPDTIAPTGPGYDPVTNEHGYDPATGDLLIDPNYPHLQYQPISSLVKCNSGDRVLLRFANVGFIEQSMRLTGIKMKVIGRDATLLKGRDGTDLSYYTDTVHLHAGESLDAIFVAPQVDTFTKFYLYSRNYGHLSNAGDHAYGGQMTEVWVYPANTLPPQLAPNT